MSGLPPSFSTPVPVLTDPIVSSNTSGCNQPKTFVDSTGYYYAFYNDPSFNIEYSSSSDGITWSVVAEITSDASILAGNQFSVWYDEPSNTVTVVRVPVSPDGNFYYSIGTPAFGNITFTTLDTPQATANGLAAGAVVFPSCYNDTSFFWVSLSTSPDGSSAFYNEIWRFNLGTSTWQQTLDDSLTTLIGSSIVGVVGGIVVARENPTGGILFIQTVNNGSNWTGYLTTSNPWDLPLSGFSTFNDTMYLSTVDVFNSLGAISYQLGMGITSEVYIGPSSHALGGAAITITDTGDGFTVVYADSNASAVGIYYSTPFGDLNLNTVSWNPLTLSNTEHIPLEPNMYYRAEAHSRPSTVVIWADFTIAIMASVIHPAIIATLVGVTDTGSSEEEISVVRLTTSPPASGAVQVTGQDTDYIVTSYHQMIDTVGLPVLYKIQKITGETTYEHPVITYISQTIQAVLSIIGNDQYEFVETGFLPTHYANMWAYQVQPQVGDHVVWEDIEWEVRNSIPKIIGSQLVYYQTLLRRVLTSGTLQSGGIQNPLVGDP